MPLQAAGEVCQCLGTWRQCFSEWQQRNGDWRAGDARRSKGTWLKRGLMSVLMCVDHVCAVVFER